MITAAQILRDIEAIEETPQNFRQVRQARKDAQALAEQETTK